MKTAKLHQLIEMAHNGKKFRVLYPKTETKILNNFFTQDYEWSSFEVTTDWEYQEIREPEVVEFELDCTIKYPGEAMVEEGNGPDFNQFDKLYGKKWKVVFIEVME